ncbi:nucleotidyltransferase substrate binding protein [Telluribacter sp. SYSU D00476]|uniref:nucleotidyltransferase substrate binding protein n=1 Tax=Telluribacter sp. SYSU D00476 TaxID=2811430 RepID=UPI001FF4DCDA|nr:nucleotidyltransferase substrate binding protein [Telluribacter sp. SYSU D00476]
MEEKDIRWQQRFINFNKALTKLGEVVENRKEALSELETEGLIQRFEYTFELAWKTLQDLLRYKGYINIAGPNPVLEQAFKDGYITDAEGWKRMKKSREPSSHTYDPETAEEIAESIKDTYYKLLRSLSTKLAEEQYGEQSSLFDE